MALTVKTSQLPNSGKGLFTTTAIKKGTKIIEYLGEIIDWKEYEKRVERDEDGYLFFINKKHCIDAWNTPQHKARFANDAAGLGRVKGLNNNSEYVIEANKCFIVAKKDIKAGDEIFVSYTKEYWDCIRYNISIGRGKKITTKDLNKLDKIHKFYYCLGRSGTKMGVQLHFIVGMGRSGTTILSKLLNRYKEVRCMPEANFLIFFLYKYRHKKHFTEYDISLIFEQIELYTLTHPLVGWEFDIKSVRQSVIEKTKNKKTTYTELCLFIYENFNIQEKNKHGSNMIIDKNTSYSLFIDKLSEAIPSAKFIWIIRDYRANVLSWKQSVYLKSPDIAYNATRWKLYNRNILNFQKNNPEKILLVRYEDLVLNYEQQIKIISSFLNTSSLDTEESGFETNPLTHINDYRIQDKYKEVFIKKYSDLNKDLNKDRLHVWKEKLNKSEIELSDTICSALAKEFGYEPDHQVNKKSGLITKLKFFIPIFKGYIEIYKDKLIYYAPISLKLSRLRKRYTSLGFIQK